MRFRLRTLLGLVLLAACLSGIAAAMLRPSVYVRPNVFDAGNVLGGTHGTSVFELSNRGSRPIYVEYDWIVGRADTSKERVAIPAGQSRQVQISWQCPAAADAPSQSQCIARIRFKTSDARRPWIDLTTVGRVVEQSRVSRR
jgi:hypothetical protein